MERSLRKIPGFRVGGGGYRRIGQMRPKNNVLFARKI